MKKGTVFTILIFLLALAGFFVYQNLGGWVRTQAQRIASEAAGVDVSIGGIQVSWADKTVQINGIKVDNPAGFPGDKAIELGNIKATAEELSREKIILKEVVVTGEKINLENVANKINLRELLKGVQERNAAKGGQPTQSDVKAPKIVIKQFRIEQGELNSSLAMLGKKAGGKLTVPEIRMYNLGEGKSSNNASEVAAKILQEILNKSIQVAAKQGLIQGTLKDIGKGAVDSVKDLKNNLLHGAK